MMESYDEWIGRSVSIQETLTEYPWHAMQATLAGIQEIDKESKLLPALWHWLYFLDLPAQVDLASDGHEKRGNFLPPVQLPRRMWAAGTIDFHNPLVLGSSARKQSQIKSIEPKQGKSGNLVFVTVQHDVFNDSSLALTENQTIVYREAASSTIEIHGKKVTETADFEKSVDPSISLLFRYSALTFNAHRIHYDREYATETEGYPGLVVHGPLLATLLMGFVQEKFPAAEVSSFQFRALKPVFDLTNFKVCGQNPDSEGTAKLWIADEEDELCMQATAKLLI